MGKQPEEKDIYVYEPENELAPRTKEALSNPVVIRLISDALRILETEHNLTKDQARSVISRLISRLTGRISG
jgi:hypothetical protein